MKVDYDQKTALVTMKPGAVLEERVVAEALKKTDRYGLTGFKEMETARKPRALIVGISGMT